MNMKKFLLTTFAIAVFSFAGAQVKTISLKKGEALDLLLLNTNTEAKEELNEYFEKAVPVAQKWGYRPQYSTRLSSPPSQGNYWPSTFILAKWEDYGKRIQFMDAITEVYPQFHERRRLIWTTFNLTFWKVEEDQEINIDPDKYYVATSYWSENPEDFGRFSEKWMSTLESSGGKVVLTCSDGTSPFGYAYDPDLFTVTEWESERDFQRFLDKNKIMDHKGVKHVNQFILN